VVYGGRKQDGLNRRLEKFLQTACLLFANSRNKV
jgi:hypothetical protein